MAKATNNRAAMLLNMAMILSLLLVITITESRSTSGIGFLKAKSVVECVTVTGVAIGDNCTAIAQKFKLTRDFFLLINPNINCDNLFVGQWVCIDGNTA